MVVGGCLLGVGAAQAQDVVTLRDIFAIETVQTGMAFPSSIAFAPAPDDRIFYVERFTGNIRIIENGVLLPAPFANVPDIATAGEQGLLTITLDPNFAANGFVYVYYTQVAGPPVPIEPTWRSIQDQVFSARCASCHVNPSAPAGLSLVESDSYAALVGVASTQVPALERVEVGNPDDSYLVRKIEDHPSIVGQAMPPTGALLDPDIMLAVRDWITAGAPYNPGDPSNPPQVFRNRILRFTAVGDTGTNPTIVLDDIPAGFIHNGGSIEFAHDGTLIVQVGEHGDGNAAQSLGTLAGKILRINADGSIPLDNPFVGVPGAREEIYSYGNRNGFGIAPDPIDFFSPPRVYVSENGPGNNDELNIIESGGGDNFGWPFVTGIVGNPSYTDPIFAWNPVTAPTGIIRYSGGVYHPSYDGNLFVSLYNLRELVLFSGDFTAVISRFELTPDGSSLVRASDLMVARFPGNPRPIELTQGPDGLVYFTMVNVSTSDGTLYRIVKTDDDDDGCGNASDPAPGVFSADGDGDSYGADCDCDDA
ncbi:MAG: PQQ-dependent sugar dehydrogenase, partial [Myxococcales bacterium]|nr:PQQ-dependent sugar dehydrogenase [Myxococcales bacterium]